MKILDVLTSPWAIQPDKLLEIQEIYATHLRGEKIDIKAVEEQIGRPLNNEHKTYQVQGGVAILPMHGVISKRMNLFSQISDGISTEMAIRDFNAAMDDPDVRAIVLDIDSPGGTVDGTQMLADVVFKARMQGDKPIVALADGIMASGAYWIGSAADEVLIADDTTHVGSIGVVATHTDISGAEAKAGRKTTEIFAGKYKRIDSQYEPLTDAGSAYLQERADYIYSIFVKAVARNRGVSESDVLKNMADGRIFIGQQAIDAGLVDGVSTLDALIARLSEEARAGVATASLAHQPSSAGGMIMTDKQKEQVQEAQRALTAAIVREEAPEVAEAIATEARAEGHAAGAIAERERIQAVLGQSIPGHEAMVQELAFDGKTSGPEAAVAVLAADRKARELAAADRHADGAAAGAAFAAAPDAEGQASEGAPIEDRIKAEWEKDASIRQEFGSFETFKHFRMAEDAGQIRIAGRS